MSELIDREAVREFIKSYRHSTDVAFHMEDHLDEIPAASPWQRVEEPPKDSKPVICWEKQGFPYVDSYFQKYGWELANNALAKPIYWMPIEPPKEGV